MTKCPKCGLTNPDDTRQCDCGYDFLSVMTTEKTIESISKKILLLSKDLEWYRTELHALQKQVEQLKYEKYKPTVQQDTVQPLKENVEVVETKKEPPVVKIPESVIVSKPPQTFTPPPQTQKPRPSFSLEEYIGGNLISKIGIAILVIGIAIGVKYAIDAGLISPLTRIVFGYIAGAGILAFALKLKKKYEGFSAVILSGGMASLYFTTFAAYSFYGLIPQVLTFAIMIVFTAFTVFAATIYDRQEIGIFGLVGAYAVPFLLGGSSDRVEILFSYMTIINIGILVLSIKKYWNILNHVAFSLSWIIFCIWFRQEYYSAQHQTIAIVFSFSFFIIFYLNFMAYKTINKENFNAEDVSYLLLNSFIYFGVGYAIFNSINNGMYLGLFTLANAVIHLLFSYAVFRNKQLDRKLFYLLMGFVICFVTIAIPIQLDGNWVTLSWAAEIFILFWIGRVKNIRFYEWLSFTMIIPGIASLGHDWLTAYVSTKTLNPFFNVTFLTSLMMIASLAGVFIFNKKKPLSSKEFSSFVLYRIIIYSIPVHLFAITYFAFHLEVSNLCLQKHSQIGTYWLLNYTIFFMFTSSLLLFWIGRMKNARFYEWMAFTVILTGIFILIPNWTLTYLRVKALNPFSNITFINSLIVISSLSGVIYFNKKQPLLSGEFSKNFINKTTAYFIPIVLFLITYFTFYFEISNFWIQKYYTTAVALEHYRNLYDEDLLKFRHLWLLNYTAFFMAAFSLLVINKLKYPAIVWSALCLGMITVLLMLSIGLSDLSTLRSHYLSGYNTAYFYQGKWYIYFRYVCFAFLSVLIYHMYVISKMDMLKETGILKFSPSAINLFILIILSSELTNLMILSHILEPVMYETIARKVGYTVLWGIYSLCTIAFGIWKKKRWIRIPAIVLFGITLIKLLIYDTSDLSTGNKVIAFIALGVLLLVVSFLYQKFKNIILGNDES